VLKLLTFQCVMLFMHGV